MEGPGSRSWWWMEGSSTGAVRNCGCIFMTSPAISPPINRFLFREFVQELIFLLDTDAMDYVRKMDVYNAVNFVYQISEKPLNASACNSFFTPQIWFRLFVYRVLEGRTQRHQEMGSVDLCFLIFYPACAFQH
jgi:hypothetical protein